MEDSAIWITWERQVRNISMSTALKIPIHEFICERHPLFRYIWSACKTIGVIKRVRPKKVYHENPSVVLALLLLFLRPFFKFKMISDTHNAGLFPVEGRSKILNFVCRRIAVNTDLIIVHNKRVARSIEKLGCNIIVMPDPLPSIEQVDLNMRPSHKISIVFICAWSEDEPFQEVIAAAEILEQFNINIFITGRPPKSVTEYKIPNNVTLTGYLNSHDYHSLITTSDCLMALTKRSNSLNCGGYEALALAKPCILSNSDTLREFFGDAYAYSNNDVNSLVDSILQVKSNLSVMTKKMLAKKVEYEIESRRNTKMLIKRSRLL